MSQEKYIGMDVHQASISAAVRDAKGKLLMEGVLETKADTILEFVQGLHGTLSLAFEEGTLAAVTRSAEATRQPTGGVRFAPSGSVERRPPERSHRRSQSR